MNSPPHPLRANWQAQAEGFLTEWVARWRADEHVLAAILTGSYALGHGGPGSDIDVVLVSQGPATLEGWYIPGEPWSLDLTRLAPGRLPAIEAAPTPEQITLFGRGRVLFDHDGRLSHAKKRLT